MAPKIRPIEERFWAKINRNDPNGCWLWTGYISSNGYGLMTINHSSRMLAHRFSYELLVGPIPDGLYLDHLCRVTSCVNPKHLEPVTPRENIRRGINHVALQMQQTHCRRGHEFDSVNTYFDPHGYRQCRKCHAARQRRYDSERKLKEAE